MIEQYTMHVEQYYKTDNNRWVFTEYNAADESISLNCVPFEIVLADIYDKVNFDLQE